jgi:hypothetical protein
MNKQRSLKLFLGIVLIALVQTSEQMIAVNVHAAGHTEDSDNKLGVAPLPQPLLNKDLTKLNLLETAYLDAYTILRQDNQCSRFFGGTAVVSALTDFVAQLTPVYMDRSIAIRMSGRTTSFQSHLTGFSYRLFEKAEINPEGPFYRGVAPNERKQTLVNQFHANTRGTRLVALLHELGHLVKGTDKKWLLSDDGDKPNLSLKNSEVVLEACHDEISAITKMKSEEQVHSTFRTITTDG